MSTSASINRARARAESLFLAFANGVGIFEHQVTSKFLIADGQRRHVTICPMFLLFEEAGKFLAGRVLSEAESSAQVELDSGKRVKVKAANYLIKFEKPSPAQLLDTAQMISQTIELELAWEFAPQEEFGFADLAREYFSDKATLEQQAGTLVRLFESPHYFRRAGKGVFARLRPTSLPRRWPPSRKRHKLRCKLNNG
jgi:exoribonuclease-2